MPRYGDPEEITSLRDTVTHFFNEDSSIPDGGTQYSGYKGANEVYDD